jgi:hypothetical protein
LRFVERDERLTPCGRALIDLERQTGDGGAAHAETGCCGIPAVARAI